MEPIEPSPLPLLDSPASCRAALRWGFDTALAQDARCISCVMSDFESWPLDDADLLQSLACWLRLPQRQLQLLAADFGPIGRALPRFEQWRRDWVHAVPAWRCPPEWAQRLQQGLFDDGVVSVQVHDSELGLGRASLDRQVRLQLAQQTDVVLQRCELAWPVKTLGL